MRISTNQFYQSGINAVGKQQTQLLQVYQQISSGRRMVTPADDPLAAAQAINIAQSKSLNERLAENRTVARQNLGLEENTLNAATNLMVDIKTRLTEAANGTLSDADRETLASVFSNLKENMLALANATDGSGQYLFSGHQGTRAPFNVNGNGDVQWQGDQGKRLIQIDQTRQVSTADDGKTVFMTASPGDRTYITAASASNLGSAILSDPVVTDPNGAHVGMDFVIEFSGTPAQHTITVLDKAGAVVDGPFGPTAYDASASKLALPGGMEVQLQGDPADGDRFELKSVQGEDLNIFETLDKLAAALATPTAGDPAAAAKLRNVVNESAARLNANYNAMLTVRSSLGSRMSEIEMLDASGEQRGLGYSNELSRLQDLDLYTSTMNLEMRRSGLEAASLAFKKIQSLSMFLINR
jgi:flagellar hook-associated protein 3 FlgL